MDKRILFIAHDNGAYGANQSLLNMISSLQKKDIFCIVIFPEKGLITKIFDEKEWSYFVINFRTELHPLPIKWHDYIKRFLRKYYKKYINFKALKKLSLIIDQYNINLIHSNSSVVSIGYELSKLKKIVHVWHLREYIHPDFGLYVYGGFENYKKKIQSNNNLISIANGVAERFGIKNKSFILYDAVRSLERKKYTLNIEKYFLFCGGLYKSKGIEDVIFAFSEVVKIKKDYKLIIVGQGEAQYEDYLKRISQKLINENKIKFLGYRTDVDKLMSSATAFIMSSRNEALGRVTVEAMLNSCNVIGYNDGGTAEIVKHKITGILYENNQELIKYMIDIAENYNEYSEIRKNAYKYATDNFLEEQYGNKLIDIYNKSN